MNQDTLFAALALMLVFEGILPFVVPGTWREVFKKVINYSDGQIRFFGLLSMALGCVLLMLLHTSTP